MGGQPNAAFQKPKVSSRDVELELEVEVELELELELPPELEPFSFELEVPDDPAREVG